MFPRRLTGAAVIAAAAAVTLTACGSSDGGGGAGKGAGSKSVAQGGKDFGTADKAMRGFGTKAKPGEFPRTITQAMGKTTLKSRPKRVVVLDVGELDNVVSLGIKPVGVAYSEGSATMPSYLEKDAGHPKNIGTINSLNLEAVKNLHPDLILGSKLRAEKQYDTLKKIAPTVFSIRPGYTWKQNYLLNAAALDKTAEAEAKLAAYRKDAKKLGADIRKKNGTMPTISMLRFMPDRIRLYANDSFIGTILKDTGLPRPKNQDVDDLAVEISPEKIDQADADWIFTGVYGAADKTSKSKTQQNQLWKNLKAVKAKHAVDVPDETWYLGLGVTAAQSVLHDLRTHLA